MPLFAEKIFFGSPVEQFKAHSEEILDAIKDVCFSPSHILGPKVEAFEKAYAAWHGVPYCVGVGSGTDALSLTMKAFGIGPGDEVITVSHTALATVASIILTGALPVLVDVCVNTSTLAPQKIEAAITDKTKAIIPVHLYGFPCEMEAIMALAEKHELIVIEDCAQAHGATYKGKKVGTIGDAGCFSFYPTKNLGAVGDGGGVITRHAHIADTIKKLRQYGWNDERIGEQPSGVSRLDPLQAAVLSVKLKYLAEDIQKRRAIAREYDRLIDWTKFLRPQAIEQTEPAYHLYVITSDKRDAIVDAMKNENVILGIHYQHSAHKNPGYVPYIQIPEAGLPVTEKLSETVLSLPIYPELEFSIVQKIAEFLNEF